MKIDYDEAKRQKTLIERDVDFEYGEDRFVSVGHLDGVMMVVVWTARAELKRIISMRKANAREKLGYSSLFTTNKV
jgi:uncharacterized protein